jgi:hypothetical protein
LESDWRKKAKEPSEHLRPFIQPSNTSWDFIYFPLDSKTKDTDSDLPVVVCVGANYADGPNKLPEGLTETTLNIESQHGRCRSRIERHLKDIGRKKPWKGKLCLEGDLKHVKQFADGKFHLVMMNLSPWITRERWSKLRDEKGGAFLEILARPPHGTFDLAEFKEIKKHLNKENVLWYGHGNSEIYGLFLHVCARLHIENWVFDSNLSQPSLYPAIS